MQTIPGIEQFRDQIVALAEQEIMPRFLQVASEHKADGSIVTDADLGMQARVIEYLHSQWPDIPLLGEEMTAQEQEALLSSSEYLWCLDPLDGTSNFAAGIPYFCTSLALLVNGQCELALIYDPVRKECFTAQKGQGADLNGKALTVSDELTELNKAIACIDLKRLPPMLAASMASDPPFASQRNFGSGALDWAWLASGRYHYYLHGGQKLWDYIAGACILEEAGGKATTLENETVPCQKLIPRSVVASINATGQAAWLQQIRNRL